MDSATSGLAMGQMHGSAACTECRAEYREGYYSGSEWMVLFCWQTQGPPGCLSWHWKINADCRIEIRLVGWDYIPDRCRQVLSVLADGRRVGLNLSVWNLLNAHILCFFLRVRAEGVMRTMTVEKLLKGMPTLQSQIDALLDFDVSDTREQGTKSLCEVTEFAQG